ncbi:NPCBM/NEW2 domain-containing protein [Actinoplanes lutulentus]|uniref:NPCBM/NEW2 domain-containing protein n=1 Tax=Actinoplanes lutulentus TaxID=1287878 RepID=A0A327YYL9_9ACTN|nr:NPCBM/NEW2 domain-containing protein [Actinoplanes lutulentus]
MADTASTWMQVVFGGISLSVAIAGLVIAYFAWVQPNSPADTADPGARPVTPPAATSPVAATSPATAPEPATTANEVVALAGLDAEIGGSTVQRSGQDLTMACPTGLSTDRQRKIQYDLAGRYLTLTANLAVSKAPDNDSQLQLKVFADDRQAAVHTLSRGKTADLDVPVAGVQKLRIELVCQSRAGEMTFTDPGLTHT